MVNTRAWLIGSLTLLLVLMTPIASASAPTSFLTTGFTGSHSGEVTAQGVKGVNVTYTNNFHVSMLAFVYVDLTNSAGQTVFVQATGTLFSAGGSASAFIGFVGISPGTYTASLFVTTSSGVPISTVTTVQVTL